MDEKRIKQAESNFKNYLNEGKIKKINKLNLLSLKLEVHEFTTREFISMIEKTQNNLGHEIVKNNIILYGTENYYNLISKWMKKE